MEERRRIEGLADDRGSTKRQSHLTWTLVGSQRLNLQPKSTHRPDLGPCTYIADEQLGLHGSPPAVPEPAACLPACGSPTLKWSTLVWPQWERKHRVLQRLGVQGGGG